MEELNVEPRNVGRSPVQPNLGPCSRTLSSIKADQALGDEKPILLDGETSDRARPHLLQRASCLLRLVLAQPRSNTKGRTNARHSVSISAVSGVGQPEKHSPFQVRPVAEKK